MSFYKLAQDIGLPIKPSKTVLPTTTLTFLGLELDTVKFETRLPQDKLGAQVEITEISNTEAITISYRNAHFRL